MRRAPVAKLTICGGFGKLSKLAAGHLDLHSRHSTIDLPLLAQWAGEAGADTAMQRAIVGANTSQEALAMARTAHISLGDIVCRKALEVARETARPNVADDLVVIEIIAIDRQGGIVGEAA
jgi:cobalt-precorrin-5B (C1)-methyltransferase